MRLSVTGEFGLEESKLRIPNQISLNPQPSFVWPETRVICGLCKYEQQPPVAQLEHVPPELTR